jgi:F-type H+-transporting ATPase subunit delta
VSGNRDQVADNRSPNATVAGRYANALFELAAEAKSLPAVEADLGRFSALIESSPDLQRLVKSPVFAADEQLRAVAAILDKTEIGGLVGNLIRVVTGNRRLFALPQIIVAFRALTARQRGEVAAEVTSAEPLNDRHVAALKDALRASLGKDVALDAKVDPALIGGLIVKVGSRMIDGSLRTKLNSLKLAMKEVG